MSVNYSAFRSSGRVSSSKADMLERGVSVSYETIRRWCAKFGQAYANELRRRRPQPGDKWHLNEVFIRINGRQHYLWRAVDQHGNVLDVLVQSRRNALVTKKFFRRLLKGLEYVPRVIVTDKLGSYQAAHRELLTAAEWRTEMADRFAVWQEITATDAAA
ncbi:IS6 family transposase [Rhodococcus sp. BH5]|nr:IS6 family transposase [Rhodococcus sp. BH5]MCZ9635296.1 IS6 family transposase [Rhodococcus sp. BH5]